MKVSFILGIAAAVSGVAGLVDSPGSAETALAPLPPLHDTIELGFGTGKSCFSKSFSNFVHSEHKECEIAPIRFKSLDVTLHPALFGQLKDRKRPCVLTVFTDKYCKSEGTQVAKLSAPTNPHTCYGNFAVEDVGFHSYKWVCPGILHEESMDTSSDTESGITSTGDSDTSSTLIARSASDSLNTSDSVEATRLRDHVTLFPADSTECNSAQTRDTDTEMHGHCHGFKKPFLSARATISRGRITHFNKGHDCVALVFSDYKCKDNGIELIDLNDEAALGVCHNVYLYGDLPAHSWTWFCKREVINSHLGSGSDSDASSDSDDVSTSFNNMDCSTTTQYGTSTRVLTDFITNTHVSTAVVTKTTTTIKTSTDVVAHHHTKVVPFSSAIKVCNVEVFHSEL
ncbi:hypothetical protein E4T47_00387 [Aureobasidium subglaciale]|nr:hypothetical protein E4T47_00387 [Aureobasidium subglaciale]